jgi:hypothetical protein
VLVNNQLLLRVLVVPVAVVRYVSESRNSCIVLSMPISHNAGMRRCIYKIVFDDSGHIVLLTKYGKVSRISSY